MKKMKNPYTFDASASRISTPITGVDFASKSGANIPMKNTTEKMAIYINNSPSDSVPDEMKMSVEDDGQQWAFIKTQIRNTSVRTVIAPKAMVKLNVYFREDVRPTEQKHLFHWVLPDNSSCSWTWPLDHEGEEIDMMRTNKSLYSCSKEIYAVFVSDEYPMNGTFYFGK